MIPKSMSSTRSGMGTGFRQRSCARKQDLTYSDTADDREPTATALRRARYPGLRARQEQRAGVPPKCSSSPPTRRRWGRARALSRPIVRPVSICRIIPMARHSHCAKPSARHSGSIRRASCAAPAPTICSICWRAPISPTATRRSTPRMDSWFIRSPRSAPAQRPWSRRKPTTLPTSTRSWQRVTPKTRNRVPGQSE